MQQDPSDCIHEWALFARTGSIYDYLSYKSRQEQMPGGKGESDADRNDRLVLRQVKVGEADQILTILTLTGG